MICMLGLSSAFAPPIVGTTTRSSRIFMAEGDAADDEKKFAPLVTGEQLEMMLQEWDTPLVVDAYATWVSRFSEEHLTIQMLDRYVHISPLKSLTHFHLKYLMAPVWALSSYGP